VTKKIWAIVLPLVIVLASSHRAALAQDPPVPVVSEPEAGAPPPSAEPRPIRRPICNTFEGSGALAVELRRKCNADEALGATELATIWEAGDAERVHVLLAFAKHIQTPKLELTAPKQPKCGDLDNQVQTGKAVSLAAFGQCKGAPPKGSRFQTIYPSGDGTTWVLTPKGPAPVVELHSNGSTAVVAVLDESTRPGSAVVVFVPKTADSAVYVDTPVPGDTTTVPKFRTITVRLSQRANRGFVTVGGYFAAPFETGKAGQLSIRVPLEADGLRLRMVELMPGGALATATKLATAEQLARPELEVSFDANATQRVALYPIRVIGCDGVRLNETAVTSRVKRFFELNRPWLRGKTLDDSLRDYSELARGGAELGGPEAKPPAGKDRTSLLPTFSEVGDVVLPQLLGIGLGWALQVEVRCTKRQTGADFAMVARLFDAAQTTMRLRQGDSPPAPTVAQDLVTSEAELGHLVDGTLAGLFGIGHVRVLRTESEKFYSDPRIEIEATTPGTKEKTEQDKKKEDEKKDSIGSEDDISDDCDDAKLTDHIEYWWRFASDESTCEAVAQSARLLSNPVEYAPTTDRRCRRIKRDAGTVTTFAEGDWRRPGTYLIGARLVRDRQGKSPWAYQCVTLQDSQWQLWFSAHASAEVGCESCGLNYGFGASILTKTSQTVQVVPVGWLGYLGAQHERRVNGETLRWNSYSPEVGVGAHLEWIPARLGNAPHDIGSRIGLFLDLMALGYVEFIDVSHLPRSDAFADLVDTPNDIAFDVDGGLLFQTGVRARLIGRDFAVAVRFEDRGIEDPRTQNNPESVRNDQRWMIGGSIVVTQDLDGEF
jgi:hypothetical protein